MENDKAQRSDDLETRSTMTCTPCRRGDHCHHDDPTCTCTDC